MDLLICSTCGTQFDTTALKSCKICDDPRQYVPPSGQSFTTLRDLKNDKSKNYRNEIRRDPYNSNMYSIWTVPQVAIGQRAVLIRTPQGNVLWDCITYLDQDTVDRVNELGGIDAIVISHPHYYSCHLEWAKAFNCKVYLSNEDKEWISRSDPEYQVFFDESVKQFNDQVSVHKVGGHFPGSSVLYWKPAKKLLVADSIMVIPSGMFAGPRPDGTSYFSFMWSYPNMIPLPPDEVHNIWKSIKHLDVEDCHAAWWGRDVLGNARTKILKSAQLVVQFSGHATHAIHQESL